MYSSIAFHSYGMHFGLAASSFPFCNERHGIALHSIDKFVVCMLVSVQQFICVVVPKVVTKLLPKKDESTAQHSAHPITKMSSA